MSPVNGDTVGVDNYEPHKSSTFRRVDAVDWNSFVQVFILRVSPVKDKNRDDVKISTQLNGGSPLFVNIGKHSLVKYLVDPAEGSSTSLLAEPIYTY